MKLIFFSFYWIHLITASQFTLITTLFNERDPVRIDEYKECLKKNLENTHIEKIVVLFEDNQGLIEKKKSLKNNLLSLQSAKIEVRLISHRPSFNEIFSLANSDFSEKNIIYANADIYFDDSLGLLKNDNLDNSLICLSRYDLLNDNWQSANNGFRIKDIKYKASFDTWIFKSPLKLNIPEKFKPGLWGCEKFVNIAIEAGMHLSNPSKDIKSYHLHGSCVRHYAVEDKYMDYKFIYLPEGSLKNQLNFLVVTEEKNGIFDSLDDLKSNKLTRFRSCLQKRQ